MLLNLYRSLQVLTLKELMHMFTGLEIFSENHNFTLHPLIIRVADMGCDYLQHC